MFFSSIRDTEKRFVRAASVGRYKDGNGDEVATVTGADLRLREETKE